ncbi:MAG TPA: selenoneine synthase SenA [Burkholderiaceae bacterium]|nr:selenoneine synthase SenA [Burkholderiaceae bacterium]
MISNAWVEARAARSADAAQLERALRDARAHTLATFAAYEDALRPARCAVPYSPELNPPLWELGHIGWFQEWWLGRNPQRARGAAADPDVPRTPPRRAQADNWFDSGRVAHTTRWELPLPNADALRDDLEAGLADSLALLQHTPHEDRALYFHRLVLFHEDMHHEAAVYMAQHLDIPLPGWTPKADAPVRELAVAGGMLELGGAGDGFVFDNELGPHTTAVESFRIDSAPVTWARYLGFVEAGGYRERGFWGDEGWRWLQAQALSAPRYVRRHGSTWQRRTFGQWVDIDPRLPVMNVSLHEAQAYCAWARRRLPSEAEWHMAALGEPAFEWGQVWEWTASPFAPFPGFEAHPYRDYSAPWFHTRQVLRGGAFATQPRMKHPRYRNFFMPDRNDVFAGFRTCAIDRA